MELQRRLTISLRGGKLLEKITNWWSMSRFISFDLHFQKMLMASLQRKQDRASISEQSRSASDQPLRKQNQCTQLPLLVNRIACFEHSVSCNVTIPLRTGYFSLKENALLLFNVSSMHCSSLSKETCRSSKLSAFSCSSLRNKTCTNECHGKRST